MHSGPEQDITLLRSASSAAIGARFFYLNLQKLLIETLFSLVTRDEQDMLFGEHPQSAANVTVNVPL
jgi:hypothetical protein